MTPIPQGDTTALSTAFALHVAGWRLRDGEWVSPQERKKVGTQEVCTTTIQSHPPDFCASMDAVLPGLSEWGRNHTVRIAATSILGDKGWGVELIDNAINIRHFAKHASLPTACVIALLRAHGVEVV